MTMLLIDLRYSSGIRIGAPDLEMGIGGQLTADIVFVPDAHLLGQPGAGLSVALSCLTQGRIGAGVGVAQAALDLAVDRLRTRHLLGGGPPAHRIVPDLM